MKKWNILLWCFILLYTCTYGQGVDELKNRAIAGSTESYLKLAEMYRLGYGGVAINDDSATYFLNKAALKGDVNAQYLLGIAMLRGLGTKKSYNKATEWLTLAAKKNHGLALTTLIQLYAGESGNMEFTQSFKKNPEKAFEIGVMAAELGNIEAIFYIANAYHNGYGVEKNDTSALYWMAISAIKYNHAEAQFQMAKWYHYSETVFGINLAKAQKYYKMTADNPRCSFELKAKGRMGIVDCIALRRQVVNLHFMLAFPHPEMSPQLKIRK